MKKIALALTVLLSGCATVRESYPSRTATEQLLISDAAEDAAGQPKLKIPGKQNCFLDTTNFEGVDAKYAVSAIRQKLMEQGIALMETRDLADVIIEIRAGALSIDSKGRQIALPGLPIDRILPVSNPLTFNQWTSRTDLGIAKISAFAYYKKTGKLISVAETVIGKSERRRINGDTIPVRK